MAIRKYNIVYKITNLINNRYYIGAHTTDNLNDDYMGSGKLIKQSILKYGKENFKKEIIFRASSKDIMYWMEKMIVDEILLSDNLVYNMCTGGEGGNKRKGMKNSEQQKLKSSLTQKGKPKKNKGSCGKWKRTIENNRKTSDIVANYRWVSIFENDNWKTLKILKEDLEEYLLNGFVKGRKTYSETASKNAKDRKYINNGINNKIVKPEDLELYFKDGWILGRI